FIPESQFATRAAWEAYKRSVIAKQTSIRIQLRQTHIKKIDDQHIQIDFIQNYVADTFHDQSHKILHMVLEHNTWKITREQTIS
ncbi:MAG: hypothetical protein Q9M10_04120, partial [Mariprofundaceae bacterium]|nr:hypothetical protein [Mariprofundaceae bacterium]